MQINLEILDKTLLVSISGDIDHHSCTEIRDKIDNIIEKQIIKNIVFDFKSVVFMDSSGIGVIIGRYKNISKIGGKVSVINLSPQIKRIFEISGLFNIIPHYGNANIAIENK